MQTKSLGLMSLIGHQISLRLSREVQIYICYTYLLIYGIFGENFWHLCKNIDELYFEQEGKIGDLPNLPNFYSFRLVSLKMGV